MENNLTVHKCDHKGNDVFAYPATILQHDEQKMVIRASFTSHKDYNIAGLELKNGDKCIEVFYFHRWFNIFEVYAGKSEQIRGWYCNITKPAIYQENHLYYSDFSIRCHRISRRTSSGRRRSSNSCNYHSTNPRGIKPKANYNNCVNFSKQKFLCVINPTVIKPTYS